MIATLIILLISAILFVSGKVRSDLVAICALLALLLCQVLNPTEALSGFSNTTVIMMVGLFIVGGGIFQTGLAKMIGSKVMTLAGNSELRLFLLVMIVTSAIGMFVSNTGTVALMLPIVVSMAAAAGTSSRRLLMPLAFASSMGGMMTLIGTPPNLIVSDTLASAGFGSLGFFSFLPVGLVTLGVGILYLLPATKMLTAKDKVKDGKDSGKSFKELVKEYGVSDNLFRVHIKSHDSKAIGQTVVDLNIYREYGINVLELRRSTGQNRFVRTVNQQLASPDLMLKQNDVLYLSGDPEMIAKFAEDYTLRLLDNHTDEIDGSSSNASLDFFDIGVAEILIMPSSSMINRTIIDAGFRSKFSVNVLGIRRKKEYILNDLGNVKMLSGDVLLVQGAWKDIARMKKESTNWVVLGEPLQEAAKVTLDYKAPVAAAIMVAMIVMMVVDSIPVAPVTSVLLAAVLMVITGCVRSVEAAYKTINWQTIVLFAAMLPMSIALEKTGVSEMISGAIVTGLGASGPRLLLAGIYAATSVMTIFISNTVTAVLMAPIALQCAMQIGVSPVPFMFAVTVAASMCFASPFSTPPNALVMSAGQYTFMDYVKVGLPLQILMGVVMVIVLPLFFPF
ncbi:MAG: SLC13 family permease [Bacteroidales bacterium]|jgi:di/tricarboxylate transporter|nr:SLC13 family permease [Bacteroidales bacterium]